MGNDDLLEMSSDEETTTRPVFWALDPNLPRIAAQAAVEFDWLIQCKHGQPVAKPSRESIQKLSLLLTQSIGKAPLAPETKGFVDTLSLNLLAKAYNASNAAHPVKTREELARVIDGLMSALAQAKQNEILDEGVLASMRDFCAAFSNFASSYRKVAYGNRFEHPYRK